MAPGPATIGAAGPPSEQPGRPHLRPPVLSGLVLLLRLETDRMRVDYDRPSLRQLVNQAVSVVQVHRAAPVGPEAPDWV